MTTTFGPVPSQGQAIAQPPTFGLSPEINAAVVARDQNRVQDARRRQRENDQISGYPTFDFTRDVKTIMLAGSNGRRVMFDVTPEVTESRSVSYAEWAQGMRQAGTILWFEGTISRTFQISSKFLARNQAEADKVFKELNLLRSWTTPDPKGVGTIGGNTPDVLRLSGYGEVFRGITCVITSLTIEFPTDVDYVTSSNGSEIPIIQSVSIALKESRSITDLQTFSIESFRNGTLEGW